MVLVEAQRLLDSSLRRVASGSRSRVRVGAEGREASKLCTPFLGGCRLAVGPPAVHRTRNRACDWRSAL